MPAPVSTAISDWPLRISRARSTGISPMPGSNTVRAGSGNFGCSIATEDFHAGSGVVGAGTGSGGPALRGGSAADPDPAAGKGAAIAIASPPANAWSRRKT